MPFNLIKSYSDLLEIAQFNSVQRDGSLRAVFKRDVEENDRFLFRTKQIRPIKKDGVYPMEALYFHLTTKDDLDHKGKKLGSRSFEIDRSIRIHWIKYHIDERKADGVEVFSYEDRVDGRNKIRTYIYDLNENYVIILEPQKSGLDYTLVTAYYLNEAGGKKQIDKKLDKKLTETY